MSLRIILSYVHCPLSLNRVGRWTVSDVVGEEC